MIEPSALFDAYINANILLVLALCLCAMVRLGLGSLGRAPAFMSDLRMMSWAFLAILASPFVALAVNTLQGAGLVPAALTPRLSDLVVAQYLNGNLDISPGAFEEVLGLRARLSRDILTLGSGAASLAVAAAAATALGLIMRRIKSALKIRAILSSSHLMRQTKRVDIRVSDRITVPFSTRGLRRRYVVLPSMMISERHDLRVALAHEFHHLRHSDLEWEIGLEALAPLLFWNPAFHLWKRQVERLREMACDQSVMQRCRIDGATYGRILLRVCTRALACGGDDGAAAPKVALLDARKSPLARFLPKRRSALAARIRMMLETRPGPERDAPVKSRWTAFPVIALILLAGISIQKSADWSHDRLMLSTIVNLERMEMINGLGMRPGTR